MHTYVSVSGVSLNYEEQYSNDGLRNNYSMRLKVSTAVWDTTSGTKFFAAISSYTCLFVYRGNHYIFHQLFSCPKPTLSHNQGDGIFGIWNHLQIWVLVNSKFAAFIREALCP